MFTVRDEAQEIKKRMVCHISATDRSLAVSIYELRVAQGEKSATTQNNNKKKKTPAGIKQDKMHSDFI